MKKVTVIIFLACIGLFWSSAWAYSAVDVLLKIDGIEGESKIQDHEGEIDILTWSWQMSATASILSGGGGAGRPIVRPLVVQKYVDKASPLLFLALLSGSHISDAVLTIRKAGESALEYIRIEMWNVQIVNISPDGKPGDDRVTESVAIAFGKVCYEYTPQKEDGSGDAIVVRCWDLEKNAPF